MQYRMGEVVAPLVAAKAAVLSLQTMPYQKDWVESLQKMELKREVAGTSKIEGADFTENELDAAMKESPEELLTRSQKQAHSAVRTYRWITKIEDDKPIDESLVLEIHRNIILGADDDHCPPGEIRGPDQNVTFGTPPHRGTEGGTDCERIFSRFIQALQNEYRDHDPLIQALAAHYHFAAMHPFLDGNGRTARALEALMLQRAGLRDSCFIAMSNYYYDEKQFYLASLTEVRANNFDLSSFLIFGLKGIEIQSRRLLSLIRKEVSRKLFLDMAYNLFVRLASTRKGVIGKRQLEILKIFLNADDEMSLDETIKETQRFYESLKSPRKAIFRDLNDLIGLHAVIVRREGDRYWLKVDLNWPTVVTETEFYQSVKNLPKRKTFSIP